MTPLDHLLFVPSLRMLTQDQQISLLSELCETIRLDRRKSGEDRQLMLLAVGLDYCASLIEDAGGDSTAAACDRGLALAGEELTLLWLSLRTTALRPDPERQQLALMVMGLLFPGGGPPARRATIEALIERCDEPDIRRALTLLDCGEAPHRIAAALSPGGEAEPEWEHGQRARVAVLQADGLISRLIGHVIAITDTSDAPQRQRAESLLQPLMPLCIPWSCGDSSLRMYRTLGLPVS